MKNKLFIPLILALGFLFTVPTMASPGLEKVPKTEVTTLELSVVNYDFVTPMVYAFEVAELAPGASVVLVAIKSTKITATAFETDVAYSPPPNRQERYSRHQSVLNKRLTLNPALALLKLDKLYLCSPSSYNI